MPEWPEIQIIAKQMNHKLKGCNVKSVEVYQDKCLNRPLKEFRQLLSGKSISSIEPLGKWIDVRLLENVHFFISLGMGGELIFLKPEDVPPEKSRLIIRFTNRSGFYVTLWWFGYFHLIAENEAHSMTDTLGPDPMDLSENNFMSILSDRRGQIKSFLLNQKRIRGIGNFYIQEILFKAGLHPLRTIQSLTDKEKHQLYNAIRNVFSESLRLGSSGYELDFFGKRGEYNIQKMAFAYQENALCPVCKTKTEKIKTGTNTQYICPTCQPLD